MGHATGIEHVKAAKKAHRCSWCAEQIDAGQPYLRWRYFGDDGPTVCKLHPECDEAQREHAAEWGDEEWTMYEQPRGCNCGHDKGCQRCAAKKALTHNAELKGGA